MLISMNALSIFICYADNGINNSLLQISSRDASVIRKSNSNKNQKAKK